MSALPKGWCSIPVSEAVSNLPLTGKKIPQKQYLEAGAYPVIDQGQSLVGGYSDDAEALVDCEPPVIVFGDHTKVVKLVKFQFAPGADGIKVLKPHEFIDCLLFKYFLDHITAGMIDKGYARHYQHLANSQIHLPPLAEQRRIVGKVEELFSELDEGVANLKQARAQLAVYRQALLKHAFEGDFPNTKVGRACSIQSGNGFPLEFQGRSQGELGFFKVGDISRNWQAKRIMLSHAEHYISKSEADSLKAKTLPAGSVVFAKIGAAVALNRRAILEVDSLVDNNVMGLIPGENLSSRFLFHFMCQIDLGAKTRGGNVPSLRRGDLEEIDMPLPSQSEQDDIVASLEQQLSVVTALQSDIDLNLQKAEALRQSILKKAFAGELVPQDPADEPAATLLERLRAEREAAALGSQTKKLSRRNKVAS